MYQDLICPSASDPIKKKLIANKIMADGESSRPLRVIKAPNTAATKKG